MLYLKWCFNTMLLFLCCFNRECALIGMDFYWTRCWRITWIQKIVRTHCKASILCLSHRSKPTVPLRRLDISAFCVPYSQYSWIAYIPAARLHRTRLCLQSLSHVIHPIGIKVAVGLKGHLHEHVHKQTEAGRFLTITSLRNVRSCIHGIGRRWKLTASL